MKLGRWFERPLIARGLLVILILVSAAVAVGQQGPVKLRDGVTLVVELRQAVRADRAKAGDQVRAKLIAPVLRNGAVVLPAGSTVLGVVSENQALAPSKN